DPSLQSITFRFWVLMLGAAISQFYYFRSNGGGYSVFFVLLVSHVLGKWMSNVLPTKQIQIYNWKFSLNPGPFNIKEHVCIAVAAAAGGGTAYATDIIAIRQLFYGDSANFLLGILLLLSTQMIGYGLAGFLRKYLVRPANMLWPSNLVFASLFTTLHGNVNDTRDKLNLKAKLAKRYVTSSGIVLAQRVSNRRNNATLENRVQMLETMLQDYYLDNYQFEASFLMM
ncbi:1460_t:CDS:2, partial [Entrophospora sp. SA101]